MRLKKTLIGCIVALVLTGFGLGFAAARKGPGQDKRQIARADYTIVGATDRPPEQAFPKSWGRLVNYVLDENTNRKLFVFEAEDGTIRTVRTRLNWDKHLIEDTDVITIARK